jgi:hypothetical protein
MDEQTERYQQYEQLYSVADALWQQVIEQMKIDPNIYQNLDQHMQSDLWQRWATAGQASSESYQKLLHP